MTEKQVKDFDKVISYGKDFIKENFNYWKDYSYIDTWQFWLTLFLVIGPLVLLFFTLDRKKILLLGFYGLNIHVWFGYVDTALIYSGLINYPYFIIPYFPSVSFEAAFIPVLAMLVYQWTINHNKNYYLYTILLSALFAFIIEPLGETIHLIKYSGFINYFVVFFLYIAVLFFSKAITSFFLYLQTKAK